MASRMKKIACGAFTAMGSVTGNAMTVTQSCAIQSIHNGAGCGDGAECLNYHAGCYNKGANDVVDGTVDRPNICAPACISASRAWKAKPECAGSGVAQMPLLDPALCASSAAPQNAWTAATAAVLAAGTVVGVGAL